MWHWLLLGEILLVGGGAAYVLYHPREPRAMLAWILTMILLPGLGLLLYWLFGDPRLHRLHRRRRRRLRPLHAHPHGRPTDGECIPPLPATLLRAMETVIRISHTRPCGGNQVRVFRDGAEMFAALLDAVAGASRHVHLEYYIFRDDAAGRRLGAALIQAAARGTACRVLVDYIGSAGWRRGFWRELRSHGVEVQFFHPMPPLGGTRRVNFRNHRKLALIDGAAAFTGSQNIGAEYTHAGDTWHDTHLRLRGPAVHELQEIFLEDWYYAGGIGPPAEDWFPPPARQWDAVVQIIPSGPDGRRRLMQQLLPAVFSAAEQEICIATPYFVPDVSLIPALQAAAYRGVSVHLLVPAESDHPLTLWAGRSYYEEICAAGVTIYEYQGGMLHSKVVIVDRAWAMAGSVNMDERSFHLNFELSLLLYHAPSAARLLEDFNRLAEHARAFRTPAEVRRCFGRSLLHGLARLSAPLL